MQPSTRPKKNSWLADQPLQRKMMLAIGLLLGLFLVTSLVTLNSLRQQEGNRQWTTHTYQVLLELDQVQHALQTSQLGARGYMLTQRADQRAMFDSGISDLHERIAHLRQMTTDNPLQQLRIDSLEKMAAQWQREITVNAIDPIAQRKVADTAAMALELQRIQSNYLEHRTVRSDDLHAAINQMIAEENQLLTVRNRQLDSALFTAKVINTIAILLGILLGIVVIRLTSKLVSRPLRRLTDLMTRLANRDHDFEIRRLDRRDEVGEIARALQVFKQMSLDTEAQTWIRSRVSDVSHVLLQATTHKEFAQWLASELVPLCGAGVGLFYSFDDTRHRLDLLGSYGLRLNNRTADQYMPGEGLVGQCAIERKAIMLDDVPENYLHIDSGTGEALPRNVSILPVLYRDTLIGVLELAGFVPLSPLQKRLLDELLPIVALTLENLNRAVSTHDLLLQTQEQADDLRVSELVMRQQKEVLRDNNEALQAKTAELEEQSERLIASEEELRVQAEELQASNQELREKTESLNRQKYVLEELQQETADKAAELARASQYKSEFLANMSHELRTPLNSLLILSRNLADNETGNLDDEQIESARIIHDAGNSLLRLINDILDLSKVEAGKMELVIDDLALPDLLRRLRRTFAHVAEEKGLGFTLDIDPGLPAVLRTDGSKLEQVANNLISNAFKFTAKGAVSLRIGRPDSDTDIPEILLGQPLIAITVSDTGIGIPPDKFQRVFNAFEQVDAGTSRQFGGTGLGLAISRRMTQLLGGDIVLRSESGRGSCFTLLLPETPPEAPAASDFAEDLPRASKTRLSQAVSPYLLPEPIDDDRTSLLPGQTTILVIEDDPAFARILIDMIHRKGYRALAAGDGESGLQLAREHHPTGILLDISLPVMDGWSVLDQLKADDATRAIPVHFISVDDGGTRGLERGAVGFLIKPVSRESIGLALERLLHFAAGQQRHLLIVDDDADSRTAVHIMLRSDNVQIDEAGSAEEALEKITGTAYDCVVLDLGLPGMSGLELLERLAETARGVPPVVVYSGRDLSREENLKLRQYTDAIVVKGARSTERLLDEVSLFLHSIQQAPRRSAAGSAAKGELAGRRVLLVDDDMRNLFALSKVMRGWGLQVNMAQDGYKALKVLADDEVPELVLMDIMMPGMDGYETIRAIRAQPHFADLPIIALTAKAMLGDREKCLEMGASDYLSKPIDIDKLASMMRVWLQR
ncbi:response regulator [Rhodanobacter sp. OK091]|uniref:response regulator n=1 Tax=Rhodanobacter sp. OK091 TaxID=1881037 RepID=UPI00091424A3|nr:response regulator [Rhodanobacter sp. OK091]SHM49919.1 multi-sensor hybrid histidine kinase [Rhodanobacter sp. OK091]